MSGVETLYRRSPVFVQNAIATGYGFQQRLLRHGGHYKSFVAKLEQSQWWTAQKLESYQNERLRALIKFCAEEVPYYREIFNTLRIRPENIRGVTDLNHLPLLEKETVRRHPELFVPRRLRERRLSQNTGGTTGKPLRYFVTPSAVQYNYAVYETRCWNWAGATFGERMASIN